MKSFRSKNKVLANDSGYNFASGTNRFCLIVGILELKCREKKNYFFVAKIILSKANKTMKSFRTRTKVVANEAGYNFDSCPDRFRGPIKAGDVKGKNFTENEP